MNYNVVQGELPMEKKDTLTLLAPQGAQCGLYPSVPASTNYFSAIDPKNAISPTEVSTREGITRYDYEHLEEGLYHVAASQEGFIAVCQILHYTAQKAREGITVELKLVPAAGDGYEKGFVMLNTEEFYRAVLPSRFDSWG